MARVLPGLARLLTSVAPDAADLRVRIATRYAAFATALMGIPSRHDATIATRCDASPADGCGKVVEVMARDAPSLMTLTVAAAFATRRSALPSSTVDGIRRRADAMHRASTLIAGNDIGTMSPTELDRLAVDLESLIARDQIQTLRRALQGAGIVESEAARRYVATLGVEQLARRPPP